jgi:RNA polymerase sigma-70 factor (ECF subfamily)
VTEPDERALVQKAQRDRQAFGVLYDRYFTRIYQFVYRRTGDEALTQDITSATFEKALANLWRFRWQGVSFGAWLYRIARNELAQHYRRARRTRPLLSWHLADAQALPPNGHQDALNTAFAKLSDADRELLTLRFFEDLESAEVAAILGCSVPNVYVRLHRALQRLRREMDKLERKELDTEEHGLTRKQHPD